jgi:hypothetical protein
MNSGETQIPAAGSMPVTKNFILREFSGAESSGVGGVMPESTRRSLEEVSRIKNV